MLRHEGEPDFQEPIQERAPDPTRQERLREDLHAYEQVNQKDSATEYTFEQETLALNLERNLARAQEEYRERYESNHFQGILKSIEEKPKVAKVLGAVGKGVAAGGAGWGAKAGITALLAGAGWAALPFAVATGAAAGLGAGAVGGFIRGFKDTEKQKLSHAAINETFNTDKLIGQYEDIERQSLATPEEYLNLEEDYFHQVEATLAHYKEIRERGAIYDTREEVSHFYTNMARLEHILQTRELRQKYQEKLDNDPAERAKVLLEALQQGIHIDATRFEGLTEDAKQFVNKRLQERWKNGGVSALKQGVAGAVLGGTLGGIFQHFTAHPGGAGGGHVDPLLAQNHAILRNETFRSIVDNTLNNKTSEAAEAAKLLNIGLGENGEIIGNLNKILSQAKDQGIVGQDLYKLAYNYLSHPGKPGTEEIKTIAQTLIDNLTSSEPLPKETLNAFINPNQFRALEFVKPTVEAYQEKLASMTSLLPIFSLQNVDMQQAAKILGTVAATAGVVSGMLSSRIPGIRSKEDARPQEYRMSNRALASGSYESPDVDRFGLPQAEEEPSQQTGWEIPETIPPVTEEPAPQGGHNDPEGTPAETRPGFRLQLPQIRLPSIPQFRSPLGGHIRVPGTPTPIPQAEQPIQEPTPEARPQAEIPEEQPTPQQETPQPREDEPELIVDPSQVAEVPRDIRPQRELTKRELRLADRFVQGDSQEPDPTEEVGPEDLGFGETHPEEPEEENQVSGLEEYLNTEKDMWNRLTQREKGAQSDFIYYRLIRGILLTKGVPVEKVLEFSRDLEQDDQLVTLAYDASDPDLTDTERTRSRIQLERELHEKAEELR